MEAKATGEATLCQPGTWWLQLALERMSSLQEEEETRSKSLICYRASWSWNLLSGPHRPHPWGGAGRNERNLQPGTGSGARLSASEPLSQCLGLLTCKMGGILLPMGSGCCKDRMRSYTYSALHVIGVQHSVGCCHPPGLCLLGRLLGSARLAACATSPHPA